MRAGIVIDDWKLATFKEILDEDWFEYTQQPGPAAGCISIFVEVEPADVARLTETVQRCQNAAAKLKN